MNKSWLEEVQLISSSRRARTLGAFELAPFVDVVLMLVIFAMMVNGFIYTPGVQINIPAISKPNAILGKTFVITITGDEKIYIGNSAAPTPSRENLISQIKEFSERTIGGVVILKADYDVKHGFLLNLMEDIRSAGVRKIAFQSSIKK